MNNQLARTRYALKRKQIQEAADRYRESQAVQLLREFDYVENSDGTFSKPADEKVKLT